MPLLLTAAPAPVGEGSGGRGADAWGGGGDGGGSGGGAGERELAPSSRNLSYSLEEELHSTYMQGIDAPSGGSPLNPLALSVAASIADFTARELLSLLALLLQKYKH
jgi:hypothetical protein